MNRNKIDIEKRREMGKVVQKVSKINKKISLIQRETQKYKGEVDFIRE